MKKTNLSTLVAVAVAVVFLSVPLKADDQLVMGPQLAMAVKAGGFNTPMLESFGNYSGAGLEKVRYTEEELTPGLVKEKDMELTNGSQSGGTDCYQKGGLSKASIKTCPQAITRNSVFKAPAEPSLMGANLDENGKGFEKRRAKRVSPLQDPGEAMGGGRENHDKEDAEIMEAKNVTGAVADRVVSVENPAI